MTRLMAGGGVVLLLATAAACMDDPVTAMSGDAAARAGGAASAMDLAGPGHTHGNHIAILDACDPSDPGWAPTGGCLIRRGDVSFAEFGAMLFTPLSAPPNAVLIGHPAWRNDPSYLSILPERSVRVTNDGGRLHTFTEVANFGGGRVPPLNGTLVPAPECIPPAGGDPTEVRPGDAMQLTDLGVGVHRFQCCIHPWMRAVIRVSPEGDH